MKLLINKQSLKFSAAHFLVFNSTDAELLHGHNYQVRVQFQMKQVPVHGLSIDFGILKKIIKQLCDQWDEKVLLPHLNSEFRFLPIPHPLQPNGPDSHLQVLFRERCYVFPRNEVELLSLTNTSVEELSRLFGEYLIAAMVDFQQKDKSFDYSLIAEISVEIEETQGQSAVSTLTSSTIR